MKHQLRTTIFPLSKTVLLIYLFIAIDLHEWRAIFFCLFVFSYLTKIGLLQCSRAITLHFWSYPVWPWMVMKNEDFLQNCWCTGLKNILIIILDSRKFYMTHIQSTCNCACYTLHPEERNEQGVLEIFKNTLPDIHGSRIKLFLLSLLALS